MPSLKSSASKEKGLDDQSTYVGSEHSARSTTTYHAHRPLGPSVTERPLSSSDARLIPLAKPFDSTVALSPPYPRVLAFPSPVLRSSGSSQGGYEPAHGNGHQSHPSEIDRQGRANENNDARRANRSEYSQQDRPTSAAQHLDRGGTRSPSTHQPIRRPWGPEQAAEPALTIRRTPRDRNYTFRSSGRLQDWEREPAAQGPYHGIASIPRNQGRIAK
ncbi:MAG: hypothetical protein LQ351_000077 [Letrouitia transgressa]|nr:MAG: hypothetical protein LQ351_000077 [Letrouitia transgressa]